MYKFDSKLIESILNNKMERHLMRCNFGLEKENVRVDKNGKLALTPHPVIFGDRNNHPYIKTDFSESQIEIVTPIFDTIDETYNFLDKLHDFVSTNLENEYLWPQSNPPYLPEENKIPIAKLEDIEEYEYRKMLAEKYGRKKQLISGIHYNFSFKEEFVEELYKNINVKASYKEFRDEIYLKISRNLLKHKWILIYLTGASPVFHKTYIDDYVKSSDKLDEESFYFHSINSIRNSLYGYRNIKDYHVSFNSIEEYIGDLRELINSGELQSPKEFYCAVRLKVENNDNLLAELLEKGIKYIEIRLLDLNPFFKNGLNKDILHFIHLFVLYMLFIDDQDEEYISKNHELNNVYVEKESNDKVTNSDLNTVLDVLEDIRELAGILNLDRTDLERIINNEKNKIKYENTTFANKIIEKVKEESFINFHIRKAKEYLQESEEALDSTIDNDLEVCYGINN